MSCFFFFANASSALFSRLCRLYLARTSGLYLLWPHLSKFCCLRSAVVIPPRISVSHSSAVLPEGLGLGLVASQKVSSFCRGCMSVIFWAGRPRLWWPSAAPSTSSGWSWAHFASSSPPRWACWMWPCKKFCSEDRSGFAKSTAHLGSAGAPGGPLLGVQRGRRRRRSSSDRGVGGLGHKGFLGVGQSGWTYTEKMYQYKFIYVCEQTAKRTDDIR